MSDTTSQRRAPSTAPATAGAASPPSSHASPPQTEGQRLLRQLDHTGGEVGARVGATRQTVHCWRSGTKMPARQMRETLECEFGIPAAAWERAPVDRPARPSTTRQARKDYAYIAPALNPPSPSTTARAQHRERPSTLDEVTQLLEELDEDASADGIMPSELARIRDTKTKALALKARIEAADALFEAQAILKHPSWRRIRGAMLDALRPFPDAARAVAEALQEAGAA